MEWFLVLLVIITACVATMMYSYANNAKKLLSDAEKNFNEISTQLIQEQQKNKDLLSKKIAADVRIGAISENLLPLLNGLPYDSKNLHHLAQPIDFLYFSYDKDEPEIVFVECKSGNAKESPRQKLIKRVIKEGRVHYDLVRINEEGVKVERKI